MAGQMVRAFASVDQNNLLTSKVASSEVTFAMLEEKDPVKILRAITGTVLDEDDDHDEGGSPISSGCGSPSTSKLQTALTNKAVASAPGCSDDAEGTTPSFDLGRIEEMLRGEVRRMEAKQEQFHADLAARQEQMQAEITAIKEALLGLGNQTRSDTQAS
eukprot:3214255-Prymnesium_polylepis.2